MNAATAAMLLWLCVASATLLGALVYLAEREEP